MKKLRVLIACEFSGIVRDAFIARGHDAISCDLLPTESEGPHYQGDVLDIINDGFDLLIAHPPCTYLSNSGLHYLKTRPERKNNLDKAFEFVLNLWNAPIEKICIENPTGWLNTNWMKPGQIIQPYYFGEPELKTTCLWLKELLPLIHSKVDELFYKKTHTEKPLPIGYVLRKTGQQTGKKYNYYWRQGKSGRDRSRTFKSIAHEMAEQWG